MNAVEKLLEIGRRAPVVSAGLAAGYLPSFEGAVAITTTSAAVMTSVGGYESARLCDNPDLRKCGLHLCINRDRVAGATVSFGSRKEHTAPAIRFHDRTGHIHHTAHLTARRDLGLLESLALSSLVPEAPLPETDASVPPPDHAQPHEALPPIRTETVEVFLTRLAALRFPLAIVLGNEGCIHFDTGTLHGISRTSAGISLHLEETTLSFDPALLGGWRVRHAENGANRPILEACDLQGRQQFYMAARDDSDARESWESMVECLP